MNKEAIDALRHGLEDSYWYSDDDEKTFEKLVAKATAFDAIVEERNHAGKGMYKRESLEQYFTGKAFWNIDGIIVDYESGDYE